MESVTPAPWLTAVTACLDRTVAASHRLRFFGLTYHPYLLMADLSGLSVVVLGYAFTRVHNLEFLPFLLTFVVTWLGYPVFLILKHKYFGSDARAYLEDLLFYLLPVGFIVATVVHVPARPMLDFAGLAVPLAHSIGRIGCFLGGCCFGRPYAAGVLYPPVIWQNVPRRRRFRPDKDPGTRVLPMQLIEAAVDLVLFALLVARLSIQPTLRGQTLPIYLIAYGVFRFTNEFYRADVTRNSWGPLSEAQWLAAAAFALGVVGTYVLR